MSREVGNVRNQGSTLCAKVDLDDDKGVVAKLSKSDQKAKNFMANWLSKGPAVKKNSSTSSGKKRKSSNNAEENEEEKASKKSQ